MKIAIHLDAIIISVRGGYQIPTTPPLGDRVNLFEYINNENTQRPHSPQIMLSQAKYGGSHKEKYFSWTFRCTMAHMQNEKSYQE